MRRVLRAAKLRGEALKEVVMLRNSAPEMLHSPAPGVIPGTTPVHGQVPDLSQPKAVEAQAPAASRPDRKDTRGGQDVMSDSGRIAELRVEARYARERYDLYRAKMYGLRPTTIARFRELERMYEGANARLRRAQQEHAPHNRG
jgi:hypothetical protein